MNYNTLVFVKNSIEEDFFIPVRGAQSGTSIENLPGGQYQGGVEDVQYLRNKLFSAIKIPASYLEDKESPDTQGSLSQKDVRFARTICRLQSFIVAELEKIAQIHLVMLGFAGEKLVNFKLSLNNPSMVWDIQEMEFLSKKLEVATNAKEFFDSDFIYRKLFNCSTEEIRKILAGRVTDAKYQRKIEILSTPPEAGGGLGGGLGGLDMGGGMGGLDMGGGLGDLDMGGGMGAEGLGELGGGELGGAEGPEAGGDDSALLSAPSRKQEPGSSYVDPATHRKTHVYDKSEYELERNPGSTDSKLSSGREAMHDPESLGILPKETIPALLGRGKENVRGPKSALLSAIPSIETIHEKLQKTSDKVAGVLGEYNATRGEKKNG
jgi:hypothetical protein